MANNFCTQCGEKLVPGAKFCTRCGAPVAAAQFPETQQIIGEQYEAPQSVYQEAYQPVPQQPVYQEAYQPAPQPVEPVAKSKKRRRGVFGTIVAVLLCISLFFMTTLTASVLGLQRATAEGNLKSLSGELTREVYDLLDELPIRSILPEYSRNITVNEFFIEFARENGVDLTRRGILTIVEDSGVMDKLADVLICYLGDIRDGTRDAFVDRWTLTEWLEDGRAVVEDVLGIRIKDSDLADTVNEIVDTGILDITNADLLERNAPAVYEVIRTILSVWLLWILLAVLVLHLTLLTAANRWNFGRTALDAGITFTVAGVIAALPALLAAGVLGSLADGVMYYNDILNTVISYVAKSFLLGGLIALALGVVLIVVGIIVRAAASRRTDMQPA